MATITVDTLNDVVDANDGVTSLREAIIQANANPDADTILFDAALAGGTINVSSELLITTDVTIDGDVNGDNIADITLDGGGNNRVFFMDDIDTDVVLNSLNVTGGYSYDFGGNINAYAINSLTIRDSTITGGYAEYGGGIAVDQENGQSLTIINSLIEGNEGTELGGGIYIFGSSGQGVTTIIGSTLTNNISDTGGGVASIASDVSVHNSTIVGNEATFRGGGLNIDEDDVIVLTNSVVAENISTNGLPQADIGGGGDADTTNSFFGTTVEIIIDRGGNTNNGGDAGLGALGDYGGTTDTLLLELGSVLIGAGSETALPADIYDLDGDGDVAEGWSQDATGNSRVVTALDIGASEYTLGANLVVSTLNDEDDGDYSAGDLSLREALSVVRDGGTITFDAGLAGGTIGLTMGSLQTPRDVTIDGDTNGDDAADIIISGTNNSGILELMGGDHVLSSLTFLNGASDFGGALIVDFGVSVTATHLSFLSNFVTVSGGAVLNAGELNLANSTFASNGSSGDGGAIFNIGTLNLLQNTFYQNSAATDGGAISAGGIETITNSTFALNTAANGGAIRDFGPQVSLINSIVTANSASGTGNDINGAPSVSGGNIIGTNVYDGTAIIAVTTPEDVFGNNILADNGGTVQTLNIVSGSSAQGVGDLTALPLDVYDLDGDLDTAEVLPTDANGQSRSDDGALDLGATDYIGPEFTGDIADGSEEFSFLETVANGTLVFDVDGNDGFGGLADAGVTYSLIGNTNGDGDANMAFAINAAGEVTINDVDDLQFINNPSGEFDLFARADNGAAAYSSSDALLAITIIDIPETITVTTLSDVVDAGDGVISLREALAIAEVGPAQDTIIFDAALSGGTVTLGGSSLTITKDIIINGDIDGDGAADITIDGDGLSRVFTIEASTELNGLNITNGSATQGGGVRIAFGSTATITNSSIFGNDASVGAGIYSGGALNLFNSTISDNTSTGDGGGLRNEGFLTLNTVTFSGNHAGDDGGAIYSINTTGFSILDLTNVTFSANQATDDGGAIFASNSNLTINNSTLTGNTAGGAGGGARFVNSSEQLNNTIVAGNDAGANGNNISGSYSSTNSLIGGNAADIFAAIDANGGGVLADNGGTVETVAIRAGGPAQNGGDAALLPSDAQDLDGDMDTAEALPLDANGNDRIVGSLDIGAAEYFGPEFEGVLIDGTESFNWSELTAQNTVLLDVDGNDGLGGATDIGVSYAITAGNDNGAFAIDSATGVITLADASAIDVETGVSAYTLTVQIDNGASSNNLAEASVTVDITDVAETLVVTTLSDVVDAGDGLLSLREAVSGANNGDALETITFDASLAGGTLTLGAALAITQDITIDGDTDNDSRADITISGNSAHSLFDITGPDTDARLLSLSLEDADGAVSAVDASSLFIMDSTISGADTSGNAGGVSSVNTDAVIVNSLLTGNQGGLAGGVYSAGGMLTLLNTTIYDNVATSGAGGITADTAFITNSTLADNTGTSAGGLDGSGSVTFTNAAVAGNMGGSGADEAQAGNLVSTNSFFGAAVSIDFDNGGNINNGGNAGLTGLYDRGASTLTLGHNSTSVLIDAGSNAALPNDIHDIDDDGITAEDLPIDGRGARIQNGTVDIGAVEQIANETLSLTQNNDVATGSGVADTINALDGNDLVNAGGGNDTVYGGNGNDNLRGDAGDDYLDGGFGADILRGGAGADVLYGGAGTDVADYTTSGGATGVTVNLTTNVNTGGDAQGDTLFFIDRVNGSSRADHITGNAAVNYLRGFAQDDTLIGGAGNDYLQGDAGADTLDGGAGTNDWAYYASSSVGVTVNLQFPNLNTGEAVGDVYLNIENLLGSRHDDDLTGDASNNFVRGLQGDDALHGGDGNDFLRGDQGADLHDGGNGVDWAYYATSSSGVTIDLGAGTASGGDAAGDTFNSIERVYGSSFADSITGTSGANYLRGSFGNDTLIGGDGNDFLQGDSGADVLDGGAGSDWAYYASAKVGVTVNLGNAALNQGEAIGDSYISIENVVGGRGDDTITGDSGNNTLRGFLGDDTLNGGAGDDILRGESGNDTFIFEVGGDHDVIIDWSDAGDMLDLTDFGYIDAADAMTHAAQVGNDVVFTMGSDSITIEDTTLADITDNLII